MGSMVMERCDISNGVYIIEIEVVISLSYYSRW